MPYTDTLIRHEREQRAHEAYDNAERARLYQDETTWLAETLDAPLEKERKYMLIDGDLYSEEGVNLKSVFTRSVEHYKAESENDPSITFQYRRSIVEMQEYEAMATMAKGEGSNTLVAVSTYPRELMGATKDILGYKHDQKTGFIRVMKRADDGVISMWTHTFDQNDAQGIEAMYGRLGQSVDWSRDILEQRVLLDLDDTDQELIGDTILYAYDKALHDKHGGNWYAGRSEKDRREAISFVEAQEDLVAEHIEQMLLHGQKPGFKDTTRYNSAIALKRRYQGNQFKADSVKAEMEGAGEDGRSKGETTSGCGVSITTENAAQQDLQDAGYKIRNTPEGEHRDVCMQCPVCKKFGVLVNKKGKRIDYTCLNRKCKATTVPKKPEPAPLQDKASSSAHKGKSPSKAELVNMRYGKYARVQEEKNIGGADKLVIDSRTGELIDKL